MSTPEHFYIHLADASFDGPPWPGERRLGPYLTVEEAQNQAASDVAHNLVPAAALVGVFTSAESQLRAEDAGQGTPTVEPAAITGQAATQRLDILSPLAKGIEDQRATLQAQLPDGVTVDDYLASQAAS